MYFYKQLNTVLLHRVVTVGITVTVVVAHVTAVVTVDVTVTHVMDA